MAKPVPQLKITVTPDLYAQAVREHSAKCMAAESIKQQKGPASNPLVDMDHIRVTLRPGVRVIYRTPDKLRALLLKFDAGVESITEPVTFIAKDGGYVNKRVGLGTVRKWAREQPQFEGRKIADTGLVSADIVEAYEAAFDTKVEQGSKTAVRANGRASTNYGKPPVSGLLAGGAGRASNNIPRVKRRIHGSRTLTRELLQDPMWMAYVVQQQKLEAD
jgi:hypothetical protein